MPTRWCLKYITLEGSQRLGVPVTLPQYALTDFELAIINAARRHIGNLLQNVFRNIQSSGLQNQYNDDEDRSKKEAAQMMCAIAFVPTDDVIASFDTL